MIARSASSLSAARHNVGRITGTGAASDLAEAIAHWDDAWQRDLKANERETRRKLLDQARGDIDGGGDPDYADRESESDDEIED